MPAPPVRCSEHPERPAAWRCRACGRALCPGCAELLEVGREVEVVSCRSCGGSVAPLLVQAADERFPESLRGFLRMPMGAAGLAGLWLLAVLGADVARAVGSWALLAWSAPMWAVALALVRASAERGGTPGTTVRVALTSEILLPTARGVALSAPVVLLGGRLGPAWGVALAAGLGLCTPTVLARLASGAGILAVLDPRWHLRVWRAAGGDLSLAAAGCIGLLLFLHLLWTSAGLGGAEVPALWANVAATLAAFSLFLPPQLTGLLVRAHGELLGFELRSRGERAAWPGAVPEHRRKIAPPARETSPGREPIQLDRSRSEGPLRVESLAGARDDEPAG